MLLVNEIYKAVQGEGKTTGLDVVFLRLSGCNLACIWCDTPYTWNWLNTKYLHPDKFDKKLEAHKMSYQDVKSEIYYKAGSMSNLVISGGEPMLQQKQLLPLLVELCRDLWHVEVETNGTIEPTDEFIKLISQFNCSPKTENSGPDNPMKLRFKPRALKKIAQCNSKATFKFVIQSDVDLADAQDIINKIGIKSNQVWLMPEGRTKEEQEWRQDQVRSISRLHGYNFSPRLHILEFGSKRAV